LVVDVVDALDGFVPSQDVADDLCEADDTFRGVTAAALLLSAGMDGFLNRPLREGLDLTDRAAMVLDPNLDAGVSGTRFSGLGVLERPNPAAAGGGIFAIELRLDSPGVVCEGVLKDRRLPRLLVGVPSIVESGFLYVFVEARKLIALSSGPELEPGLLSRRDGVLFDPSDWWLEPGRERGFFLALSGS
jgi:hypothetical protein